MKEHSLDLFNELAEFLFENEQDEPMAKIIPTASLNDKLDLSLPDDPIDQESYIRILKDIIRHTPKTASKKFFNQLFGGRQEKAVLGDLMAVLLNNSMYTYKVAGPQVGIEKNLINKSCELAGFGANSGGTFAAGGSMTNYMSMLMARDSKDSASGDDGAKPMIAYTSEASHYSTSKNMSFIGLGRSNLRKVAVDKQGKMLPDDLESKIKEDIDKGLTPFYVNATAGTTVLGSFDPIDKLAQICKKYNLWLHVDGAYCGSVIFSETYKHLIRGLAEADSFSYNAHKMLGTPLSCSLILVQDKKHLYQSFSTEAEYLYQTDIDDFNLGKISLQCGRRNDAFKFWTLWKAIGKKGLEAMVNKQFELANVAREYIKSNSDYQLYSFDESLSVCFTYKNLSADDLCTALYEKRVNMVGYGQFKNQVFVRLVTINPDFEANDILAFFKDIEGIAF